MPPMQAAVEATREIGLAVLATTLSLVAIFVPVGFMGGIVGRFMKSFGLTMAFAIMVSLLVSFTLTPMLAARWLKVQPQGGRRDAPTTTRSDVAAASRRSTAATRGCCEWSLAHRRRGRGASPCWCCCRACRSSWSSNKNFMPERRPVGVRGRPARAGGHQPARRPRSSPTGSRTRVRGSCPRSTYTLVTVGRRPGADAERRRRSTCGCMPIEERDARPVRGDGRRCARRSCPQFAAADLRTGGAAGRGHRRRRQQSADIQFVVNGPDLRAARSATPTQLRRDARRHPGVVDVDTSLNVGKPELVGARSTGRRRRTSACRSPMPPRRCGCWSAATRSRPTTRAASSTRCTCARDGRRPQTARGDRRAHGAVVAAGQRAARQRRDVRRRARRRPRSTGSTAQRQVTVFANLLPGASQTPVHGRRCTAAAAELNIGPGYRTRFAGPLARARPRGAELPARRSCCRSSSCT